MADNFTDRVEQLFQNQLATWPRLARGVEGLTRAQTRAAHIDWFEVFIRHIPHRIASTTAAVDEQSIAKRPCFLCPANLDPEERGIPFSSDYTIYCNPFPIVELHLTIVHREHRPQRIEGEIGAMLDLARALPALFIIYNGPECGASAPDHMHFQAGSRALFPIEEDLAAVPGPVVRSYGRSVIVLRDSDPARLTEKVRRAIAVLVQVTNRRPEPLLNIAAFFKDQAWTVYVFPRARHRPDVYYSGRLTVSPASIDLCGIFVVPLESDFGRISGEDIRGIFQEVTLQNGMLDKVIGKL
jgi:hypothetical protein